MGYLYIFQEGTNDFYKAGISKNFPDARKAQLQTGNPRELRKVKYYRLRNYKQVERRVHQRLAQYRTNGGKEWFHCDKETILKAVELELTGKKTAMQNLLDLIAYMWTMAIGLFVLFLIALVIDGIFLGGNLITLVLDMFY